MKSYVSKFQNALLMDGIAMRGAITIGNLYSDKKNNLIVGASLIDAIEKEMKIAIYPRIIISNQLMDYCKRTYPSLPLHSEFTRDFDGIFYVNYLSHEIVHANFKKNSDRLRLIHAKINENLFRNKNNLYVLSKWYWLANYFDKTLDNTEHRDLKLDDLIKFDLANTEPNITA